MTTAIQIEKLMIRVGRRDILNIPRLEIGHGELVGLLGPNGAGKSTLLRCLLGMQGHVRGHVSVLGHDVRSLRAANLAALRRRIGYVPQLLPARSEIPLTVREVVAIGRTGIAGLFQPLRREDWMIIDQWIERLGLSSLANQGFGEISGGEQRKTLIARAMVQQPELLLLDEPTANLDLGWRERIVQTISELYQTIGLTVLLVCHELEVLPIGCGRMVVLQDGEILADGAPERNLITQWVASLYGPGLDVMHNAGRWAVIPVGRTVNSVEIKHA